ncbi:hypothetical protein E6C27_scaffold1202G00530 [Cucumis melo var. makuwa]|uniref:Uncharacterized protein n=1 Tax=Cucumis melo var. makuwa TaxID=1194695 RepID=A0A5A7TQW4_CUCMM|nr:hypothetical protein E6C27_scaffold1202G00530 [Cucumis melo var. makuwa]
MAERPSTSLNSKTWSYLSFLEGIRELTTKFSGSTAGLIGDSSPLLGWIRWAWTRSRGITKCQVRDFLLLDLGSRLETYVTASCSLCAIVCNELFTDRHRCPDVLCIVVLLMGYVVNWICMSMDYKVLRLGCRNVTVVDGLVWTEGLIGASFGITRLICASFGITRLIGVSFGVTRLIRVSFGITRLIRASFGITRLMCKGTAKGRPTRGKKDA